jgi:hypothetical protein
MEEVRLVKHNIFTGKIPRQTPLNNRHLNSDEQECKRGRVKGTQMGGGG